MRCPYCNGENTQVKDSRPTEENAAIRRRRACEDCSGRFTTYEVVEETMHIQTFLAIIRKVRMLFWALTGGLLLVREGFSSRSPQLPQDQAERG